MTQHICMVCRHAFGKSTFPGGSTSYCSRTCGTRWGTALLPKPTPAVICCVELKLGSCTRCGCALSLPRRRGVLITQCRGGCPHPSAAEPKAPAPPAPTSCAYCAAEIVRPRRGKRYCTTRCREISSPRRCTVADCPRPHRAKGLCHRHYKEQRYPDQTYTFPTDPDAKRARDQIRSQRRRAAGRRADAENVDRNIVGARDGWCCGICGEHVDRTIAWPDPLSPSLDHVVPISHGGAHTYANSRVAHLRCNMLRGNRGGGEQLALVG